jgi:plastocyanin
MKKTVTSFLIFVFSLIFFPPQSHAEIVDISIRDNSFNPAEVTITEGDTVRWTHNGFQPHTTTSGLDGDNVDGLWDSGTLFFIGQTFSLTFNVPEGTFPYHCTFHWGTGMKGTIIVQSDTLTDTIPLPSEPQSIGFENVSLPELNLDPLQAKPVGLGPVATGGLVLNVQVGLDQFSEPVDIYGAYSLSTSPNIVNVLEPGGKTFQALTIAQALNAFSTGVPPAGIQPWLSGVAGPVNESLFNTPVFNLPDGTYMIYLLVTPVGDTSAYYLWVTNFSVP